MTPGLPTIVILAGRIRSDVENAVRHFPRFHKFATGGDLRQQIARIQQLAVRAWRDRERRPYWTDELVFAVDDFKNTLQCASLIKAFASHAQFEALARLASELGQQCGGWRRQQQRSGQNGEKPSASIQRAQTLSSPAASPAEAFQ